MGVTHPSEENDLLFRYVRHINDHEISYAGPPYLIVSHGDSVKQFDFYIHWLHT